MCLRVCVFTLFALLSPARAQLDLSTSLAEAYGFHIKVHNKRTFRTSREFNRTLLGLLLKGV